MVHFGTMYKYCKETNESPDVKYLNVIWSFNLAGNASLIIVFSFSICVVNQDSTVIMGYLFYLN
jgi:hypothetical protein